MTATTLLAELPQPSRAYKRRVWLAVTGLAIFIALYFLLAGWFVYTAYRLTIGASEAVVPGYLVGGCALFLAVMMLKPVFFVKHGGTEGSVEITPEQQPRLFAFLYELADAAVAPRPHRVFLSARVNAAVFYDLSALNLIFPSKKNLEIGLALVNALSLGEFRAVLAHEFGHFTQRSMAVMRWGYLAQQIAAYLVTRRDKLDELLLRLSHLDVRVAWVGWILSLIVWSIRSLVDTAFGMVVLLQRALSREMEFQADLVAVALTGSDALVHALHRLQAADDSWDRTLNMVGQEHAGGRIPRDVFPLHRRVMERMGGILSDPAYGRVPAIPADRPEAHRLFKAELAQPPRMWLTHPLNHDREANAKRRYVSAPIDDRSAWTLFDNPEAVREQVTTALLDSELKQTVPIENSLAAVNAQFESEYLNSRYRGVYLGRSVVRAAVRPEMLVEPPPNDWRRRLDDLYPESLVEDIARLRSLRRELSQLRALRSGALKPPDEGIRHRGRTIALGDLPQVIGEVEREVAEVEARLASGDRMRRSVYLAAANELGDGWAPYLQGLLAALHYADHTTANLEDLHELLGHTVAMVTVTRRVSSRGRARVVAAANELQRALHDVFAQSKEVILDAPLLAALGRGITSWSELFEPLKLGTATKENIGEWLKVVDGWVHQATGACSALQNAALQQLLLTEASLAEHIKAGTRPSPAPTPSRLPATYAVLLSAKERERQNSLNWWERFQIADGAVPTVARVAVAAAIVVAVLGFGRSVGTATITVYNGLATPVTVSIGGNVFAVPAFGTHAQSVDGEAVYQIETRTGGGKLIEQFSSQIPGSFGNFVYNVGGVAPMVEWTAIYGNARRRPERMLGAPRWTRTAADVLFDKAPESVSTSSGGAVRLVLTSLADMPPLQQLSLLGGDSDRHRVITAHLRWDSTNSARILDWFGLAERELPSYRQLLRARLVESPNDVVLLRAELDGAAAAERDSVCARDQARAAAIDNADLQYIAARCIADEAARTQAFREGHARWPSNGWFAYAAGYDYTEVGDWPQALAALETARTRLRPLASHVSVDLARVHRLVDQDAAAAVAALTRTSEELHYLVTVESGQGLDSTEVLAYSALARGELDRALSLARSDSAVAARVLRFAAASDGASEELQSRALDVPNAAGLDNQSQWAMIGLALRNGRDRAAYLGVRYPLPQNYVDQMLSFLDAARTSKTPAAAEPKLKGLPLFMRGEAYAAAVVMLGDRAPAAWRGAARRLLFASERPYFR